nr:hypothetical protein Iba_chr02eCG7730 [Ipomoea batatas]
MKGNADEAMKTSSQQLLFPGVTFPLQAAEQLAAVILHDSSVRGNSGGGGIVTGELPSSLLLAASSSMAKPSMVASCNGDSGDTPCFRRVEQQQAKLSRQQLTGLTAPSPKPVTSSIVFGINGELSTAATELSFYVTMKSNSRSSSTFPRPTSKGREWRVVVRFPSDTT